MTVYRTKSPRPVDVSDFESLAGAKSRGDSKEVEVVYDDTTKKLSVWSTPEEVSYAAARRISSLRL